MESGEQHGQIGTGSPSIEGQQIIASLVPPGRTTNRVVGQRRLPAQERGQQIVAGAIRFFAQHGFEGRTRELAKELGIAQPLLYRYFPSKRALIEAVVREVYINPIETDWASLLTDRTRPIADRLEEFYGRYAKETYRYEWIRIYMHSGLIGEELNRRYIAAVEEKILKVMCAELRHTFGLPDADATPISDLEIEHLWVLHGGLFYYAVRKFIYRARVMEDFSAIVHRAVKAMVAGTRVAYEEK
ncbi:MAG TPA: TetR/AcrR family transcriptional regulator [Magnetospirillaceae bacterium]|jgi:AcrR family transcriptional regulator